MRGGNPTDSGNHVNGLAGFSAVGAAVMLIGDTPNPTALTGFVKWVRFPDPNPGPDGRVRPAADIGTGNRRGERAGVPSLNRAGVPVAR